MKFSRRLRVWLIAAVLLLVVGIAGYCLSGSAAIESWVGSQLLQLTGAYLQPDLHFDRLTYLRPRTILLDHLTLSTPDPSQPGRSVVILAVKHARLELTEIPWPGRPVKFSQVILENPEVHAIAAAPGASGLIGFSHFLKSSPAPAPAPASAPAPAPATAAAAASRPSPMKISDWLLMRRVEIINGRISYESQNPGAPPLWLDEINARLDFAPAEKSKPGLYAIATTISRKPAFSIDLQGQVDIDALRMELAKFELNLDLQQKNAHFLPPDLQRFLKTFEVTGQLRLTADGTLPLTRWRAGTIRSNGELTAAQVAAGQNRLSIGRWVWEVALADGVVSIRKADAQLLGGEMHFTGTIPLDGSVPAILNLSASKLKIQRILRSTQPDQPPLYAGDLDASIRFTAPLATWNKNAAGGGTFTIRQGRIANIPILGTILASLSHTIAKSMGGSALTDTADCGLSFAGDCVRFDRFDGTSGAMAIRGTGTVGFDRRLDLRLNAGPMERVQNSLGPVGQVWADISDAMAGYRVGGTLEKPVVSVEIGKGP